MVARRFAKIQALLPRFSPWMRRRLPDEGTRAMAHRGYTTADDIHHRILLGVFDAAHQDLPPSAAELRQRTGLARACLAQHIPLLAAHGLLAYRAGRRRLVVTRTGLELLAMAGLIAPLARVPSYALTTRGVELLERAPQPAGEMDG
jgi:hypothetical protein